MSDTLISRLEAAETRADAVTAFMEVPFVTEVSEDFKRHVAQALRSGSDTRAMGYLLLAALTLVPERLSVSHLSWHRDGGACVVLGPDRAPDLDPVEAATPALSLCIASLRAREADLAPK